MISIVIPSYNRKESLRRCLGSINENVGIRYEVIVADNASAEDYGGLETEFDHVRVLRLPENRGYAGGCNAGAREAKGEYIVIVDDDIEVLKGSLEAMLTLMENDKKIGIAGPTLITPQGNHKNDTLLRFPDAIRHFLLLPPAYGYVMGAAFMIRKDIIDRLGFFDEDYFIFFEEVDLCLRVKRAGYDIRVIKDARVVDYPNPRGLKADGRRMWLMERNRLMFFLKNYSFLQVLFRPLADMASLLNCVIKYAKSRDSIFLLPLFYRPLAYFYFLLHPGFVLKTLSRNRYFFSFSV